MRELFAYICVFKNPINALELFKKFIFHFYKPSLSVNKGISRAHQRNREKLFTKYPNFILPINNIDSAQMAWTGIIANLLINGRTVHTTFKLPLYIFENTTCGIKFNSKEGIKLISIKIVFWDEISLRNS